MSLPIPSPVILSQCTNGQVPWCACAAIQNHSLRLHQMYYYDILSASSEANSFFRWATTSAHLPFSPLGALKPPKRLQSSIGAIVFANPCGLVPVVSSKGNPEQSPHSQSVELVGWLNDRPSEVDGFLAHFLLRVLTSTIVVFRKP